ncbi:phage tail tape measure protein [Bosea sp. (in: a-proteobacteria)]|uniref:phage tail tape measure protein n=1 Tax=Bosea sp. (in: a-proteobacteria) TaxID=1871050 RepID=UPI0026267118|nr:phage tail tape measure protein [Bosea sp. (in: a-proteobacteria)]MCO5092553.1 phage tail tape measure protein [Bosea sp. (in: a-proteobacteria)]
MTDDDGFDTGRLADLRTMDRLTQSLSRSSESFGKSIVGAFSRGIVEGKRFEDVLRSVGRSMTDSLLKTALKPLQSGLSSLLGSGIQSLSGLFGGLSLGGAGASLPVAPFAEGGIVASPSYFPTGRGLGLMAERGAEAIMPLARGPDGRLGVRAGGGQARPLSVVVQVSTPDAESFRRSEAQVSAAIARAVARGGRAL